MLRLVSNRKVLAIACVSATAPLILAVLSPAGAYHNTVWCLGEQGGHGSDPINDFGGNDTYNGTTGANVWSGWNGQDTIRGAPAANKAQDGNDNLCGDGGVQGEPGIDHIWGYAGHDELAGGKKGDFLHGGPGNDDIYGNDGNDDGIGSTGDDLLSGANGNDDFQGDDGADRVYGDAGDDTLYGGNGNDYVNGGPGTDKCYGGAGTDSFLNCETAVQGSVGQSGVMKILRMLGLRPMSL